MARRRHLAARFLCLSGRSRRLCGDHFAAPPRRKALFCRSAVLPMCGREATKLTPPPVILSKLVAARRHGRRRAMLAALPVAPAAPLSQKSRFAAIFGSPVIIARRVEKSCIERRSCFKQRIFVNLARPKEFCALRAQGTVCPNSLPLRGNQFEFLDGAPNKKAADYCPWLFCGAPTHFISEPVDASNSARVTVSDPSLKLYVKMIRSSYR